MNTVIEFDTPVPSCLRLVTHQARAVTPACETDIRRTISQHTVADLDDYDRVMRDDWLSAPGGMR